MKHVLTFMMLALLGASGALAQIAVKIVPEKKTFLTGEANYMRLTVTNNSGTPVELKSREYSSWLDIHVEHTTGEPCFRSPALPSFLRSTCLPA